MDKVSMDKVSRDNGRRDNDPEPPLLRFNVFHNYKYISSFPRIGMQNDVHTLNSS